MNIVDFIEARIAEDEAVAREAIDPNRPGIHWEWEAPNDDGDPESLRWLRTVEEFPTTSGVGDLPGFPLGFEFRAAPSGAMTHIARHDPARVLRQCAALREWLERAKPFDDCRGHPEPWLPHGDYGPGYCRQPDASEDLCVLAAIWSDHPDYQQEWT